MAKHTSPLESLRQAGLAQIKRLRAMGVDPYPAGWEKLKQRRKIQELKKREVGQGVVVAGRVVAVREHGKLIFMDVQDDSDEIQVSFRTEDYDDGSWEVIRLLNRGDFVGVEGELYETKSGELTVAVSNFKLLSKAVRPLPVGHFGLEDIETRYRQRYVDLVVNPEIRGVFEQRTRIVEELRRYLNRHNFVEVETPILQPIYGGASARPFVTHHNALDVDLYLRISDELYLKRLIVGGFEKVYEFGRDFRNEGIDRQHNPEFTQLEFYWAYADYEDLMKFTEKMIAQVMQEVIGTLQVEYDGVELDFTPPWRRISFRDLLLEQTGIDINQVDQEAELLSKIRELGLSLDLDGVVGYGALVDELYKETSRPSLIQPTLLLDYPAEMVALAKKKTGDPTRVASFQLLVKGFEVIKAYNELNDPVDQKVRWQAEEQLGEQGLESHQALDEDYLRALEYGMPPTAGWGMGIDRFTALVTGQLSIKDVILFPTLRPEG